ncbi:MAG TPA: enoyl-CoA hydratase family protein [Gemmatimonadaceae bacterium]|nr:enoyl-CoA hydratase family protein [Gemmatimonadaceae bacterium]
MIAPKTFRYAVDGHIATITLDRPETLNSLTFAVYAELRDTFRALEDEGDVHAIVITGAGRGFCSGGSVNDIIGPLFAMSPVERMEFTRMTGALIGAIRAVRKPVVAAINGVAAGAGAVIALACDFRVMAEKAKIAFLFVKVGLAGADMGAAWLLPQVVGLARATEILMLGDAILAEDALRMGLANRVVAADAVVREARGLAERLARGPRFALGMTKEMLNREPQLTLEAALEAEAQAQQICMATDDFREAYEAFTNKREPRFTGK